MTVVISETFEPGRDPRVRDLRRVSDMLLRQLVIDRVPGAAQEFVRRRGRR